jgi:hypothetical protein
MNGRVSLFGLTSLPFELFTQASCVPDILQSRKPKSCRFFKICFLEKKGWTITHEKCHFLLDLEKKQTSLQILHEERNASYLPNDAKEVGFWWMKYRINGHWNQLLF